MTKAIIIPGNGGATPEDNWFPYVERELCAQGIETINTQFPDAILARKSKWLPFLETLGADENTILIGHSSGAVAALCCAETHQILGSVLVAVYDTDLGMPTEKLSGYFNTPWDWDAIKKNQQWIIQFASSDDPYFPIDHPRLIHDKLDTEYYEYSDRGHFGSDHLEFPELVAAVVRRIQ